MKIHPEHYAHMRDAIKSVLVASGKSIADCRAHVATFPNVRDVEKRLRWDLSYAAKLSPWICDNIYSYADDTHIDTALRVIVKELAL